MTLILPLILKIGPWIGMAVSGLILWITVKSSKAKVATAQASAATAQTTVAQVQSADAVASATVADASKQAVQNTADISAQVAEETKNNTDAANRKALQDEFGRPS